MGKSRQLSHASLDEPRFATKARNDLSGMARQFPEVPTSYLRFILSKQLLVRLWILAFSQYAIWGLWYVTMGTYLTKTLKFTGGQVGLAYGTPAVGAMISPFLVGLVADRYFSAEKILATLHLVGAGLLYYVSTTTSFPTFYGALVVYTIGYMGTLALTNTLTLRHVTHADREFPLVMLMASVGWIVAGLIIGQAEVEASAT